MTAFDRKVKVPVMSCQFHGGGSGTILRAMSHLQDDGEPLR